MDDQRGFFVAFENFAKNAKKELRGKKAVAVSTHAQQMLSIGPRSLPLETPTL